MRKFNLEDAIAAIELEQMVADYFHTLDTEGGEAAAEFFSEDVDVAVAADRYQGTAAMKAFYKDIGERMSREDGGTARTMRHGFINFRIAFPVKDRATINLFCVAFTGKGGTPVENSTTPACVTDVRLECRRQADGQWRIFGYYGGPVFLGDDKLMNRLLTQG